MKNTLILSLLLGVSFSLLAETPASRQDWLAALSETPVSRNAVDEPVSNNKYFMESIRASNLAKLAYEEGDYDLSMQFSADAIKAARLSDELITAKLKIAEANKKINEAGSRLTWADKSKAQIYFPKEYNNAKNFYDDALNDRNAGEWDGALNNAIYAVQALSIIAAPPNNRTEPETDGKSPLPAQYTVRPWDLFGDCFWNIAGREWVYGNPYQWPLLYHANKSKLPDPNNPNLIEPGIIIDIPSLRGEIRKGMWDSGKKYVPLQ
ncbi:MAG: LysM peptidoglycan-binding domain-containing protein [Spirochaetaceae bacterium]|jgi:hypothetical protein|nr:LysM peptidoglycan-binding domain-containing protein [Spirochaetaceae bacterium]